MEKLIKVESWRRREGTLEVRLPLYIDFPPCGKIKIINLPNFIQGKIDNQKVIFSIPLDFLFLEKPLEELILAVAELLQRREDYTLDSSFLFPIPEEKEDWKRKEIILELV